MILRSSVVLGRIGIDGAFFVLRIADEIHPWWMVKRWCHRLESRDKNVGEGAGISKV
jgi:hypothetical protein